MKKNIWVGLGFLISPLIPAIILAALTPIGSPGFSWVRFGLVPVFYVFSFVAIMILGIPAYVILQRLKLINPWVVLGAGAVAGSFLAFIWAFPSWPFMNDFIVLCPTGMATALTIWLFWRRGQKDL